MTRHGLVLLAAAAAALAGCANTRAEQALAAQTALVGMPETELLACAGVPERRAEAAPYQYLTYVSRQLYSRPGPVVGFGGWDDHVGVDFAFPVVRDYAGVTCEATFTLRDGVVERVVYGGSAEPGYSQLSQCFNIVANCLR